MSNILKLTEKELEGFVSGNLPERFEEVFNDLPCYHADAPLKAGESHRMYIEDDGREFRWFIFKDTKTGAEYNLNYTYHPDWPGYIYSKPDNIVYVKNKEESDIYVAPEPVIEKVVVLNEVQQRDKELLDEYETIKDECRKVIPKEKLEVPKEKIKELLDLLKQKYFTIQQVRALAYPICIEYRLESVSFWHWVQVKRGVWKG